MSQSWYDHGLSIKEETYLDSGEKDKEIKYENGKIKACIYFDKSGNIRAKLDYQNGVLSRSILYSSSGKVLEERNIKDGPVYFF